MGKQATRRGFRPRWRAGFLAAATLLFGVAWAFAGGRVYITDAMEEEVEKAVEENLGGRPEEAFRRMSRFALEHGDSSLMYKRWETLTASYMAMQKAKGLKWGEAARNLVAREPKSEVELLLAARLDPLRDRLELPLIRGHLEELARLAAGKPIGIFAEFLIIDTFSNGKAEDFAPFIAKYPDSGLVPLATVNLFNGWLGYKADAEVILRGVIRDYESDPCAQAASLIRLKVHLKRTVPEDDYKDARKILAFYNHRKVDGKRVSLEEMRAAKRAWAERRRARGEGGGPPPTRKKNP